MAYSSKEQLFTAMAGGKYKWPKHWRATIDRLTQFQDPETFSMKYAVRPINPEYVEWYNEQTSMKMNKPLPVAPLRYLDMISFDTIDELDQWAYTVWRMMK